MPFSDYPPSFVVPDSDEGLSYARNEIHTTGHVAVSCSDYKADTLIAMARENGMYRLMACANRRHDGVRAKNWCMRCPAGFMLMQLDQKDKDNARDSATRLYS